MNDGVMYLLKKMFEKVGLDNSPEFIVDYVKKEDWFLNQSWSIEKEEEYIKEISQEIMHNSDLRNLLGLPKNKKIINSELRWFLMNCGWKIDEEPSKNREENNISKED